MDTAAPVFVRFPRTVASTAVIVLHDVSGLTDPAERAARELARRGHLAVAPILYHDTGGRVLTGTAEEAADTLATLPLARLSDDVAGALDYVHRRCGIPATGTALLGLGSGGYLAARAACEHELAAAAGVRPWHSTPQPGARPLDELTAAARTPWLAVAGTGAPYQDADPAEDEAVHFVESAFRRSGI
nr:dienelactone hydrolase family protein [Haloechinothrix aidingensis]